MKSYNGCIQNSVKELSQVPQLSLPDLISAPLGRSKLVKAHSVQNRPLYLWPNPTELIDSVDSWVVEIPDIEVIAISDCAVIDGVHLIKDQQIIFSPDAMPDYVKDFYINGRVNVPTPDFELHIDAGIILFTFQSKTYGHFFLESFPKVVALLKSMPYIKDIPVIVPPDVPQYMLDMLSEHVPGLLFLRVEIGSCLHIDHALMPSMANTRYSYHVSWPSLLQTFGLEQAVKIKTADRIYLSKKYLDSSAFPRSICNEDEIESILEGLGFSIVFPHQLNWREKAAIFASSSIVVGEYGSGLHNSILCAPGTMIISLNWINHVQQGIARSCGHKIGILLAEDGAPRLPGGANPEYRIDPFDLREKLGRLGIG